jgi:hypothetical protein
MAQTRTKLRNWMQTKVCPSCGYSGRDVQVAGVDDDEAETFCCPCCENDLYARPAMSYAEMEGFTSQQLVETMVRHASKVTVSVASQTAATRTPRPSLLSRCWAIIRKLLVPTRRATRRR